MPEALGMEPMDAGEPDVGAPDPDDALAVRIAGDAAFVRRSSTVKILRWGDLAIVASWMAIGALGVGIGVLVGGWGGWIAASMVLAIIGAMFWLRGHAIRHARSGGKDQR